MFSDNLQIVFDPSYFEHVDIICVDWILYSEKHKTVE